MRKRKTETATPMVGGPRAVALLAVAVALAACADEPTRPASRGLIATSSGVLTISAQRAGAFQVVLQDARERSLMAIDRADARDDLKQALEIVSTRMEARDRRGVERGLRNARAALDRYRAMIAEDAGALPDVEAIALMLTEIEASAAGDATAPSHRRE